MNRLIPIIASATMMLTACRPAPNDFSDYRFIDPEGWEYGDTLVFVPELRDAVAEGSLSIALRHTNDYLYSNLWVEVVTTDSIGSRTDTINIVLADNYGRWQGRGIGTDFQVTDTIAAPLTLHRPATVKVRHIMRSDRLGGIEQVGVAFNDNQKQ